METYRRPAYTGTRSTSSQAEVAARTLMSPSRAGSAAGTPSSRIARGPHRCAGDPTVRSMAGRAVIEGDEILDDPGGVH
ncbi:hypothetical protein [Mycobacterium leprae]|uniref:hypothetical protein n=1 Tax=Mycobacterium leprae TaxID=1769 RepID=UPI000B29D30E|nr:hypothetical protein [Mycobacterium leprae]